MRSFSEPQTFQQSCLELVDLITYCYIISDMLIMINGQKGHITCTIGAKQHQDTDSTHAFKWTTFGSQSDQNLYLKMITTPIYSICTNNLIGLLEAYTHSNSMKLNQFIHPIYSISQLVFVVSCTYKGPGPHALIRQYYYLLHMKVTCYVMKQRNKFVF